MDGRPQRKVAAYLSVAFRVRHLDSITTAGLVRHLASDTDQTPILLANLDISLTAHGSHRVAIVAHHDCAGNPVSDEQQAQQLADAVQRLSTIHPETDLVGLWVNEHWTVEEVTSALSHYVGEGQSESASSSSKDTRRRRTGPFVEEEDEPGGDDGRAEPGKP